MFSSLGWLAVWLGLSRESALASNVPRYHPQICGTPKKPLHSRRTVYITEDEGTFEIYGTEDKFTSEWSVLHFPPTGNRSEALGHLKMQAT